MALVVRAVKIVVLSTAVMLPAVLVGLLRAVISGRTAGKRHVYRQLTSLLMLLGPTFVKAGQVLGTRRDLLPAELCAQLSVLQDSVSPMNVEQTRLALREAYGDSVDEIFAEVDLQPVASGSVASVYRAGLGTGADVAVKLRRPGIEEVMRRDLTLIHKGAALVARLPVFRGVPVTEVVGAMADAVLGQLDFEREADALIRLRENLSAVPRVWVPQVYPEACTPQCVVMEYIPGLALDTAEHCTAAARKRFAASGLSAMYQMLFVDGFVHCDMHPGNLYFTSGAQVIVLDAGFSVQLSERMRRLFAEFFMNMSIGRGRKAAEIVIESSAGVRADADIEGFTVRMADLVERSHGQPAKEFSLIAFATEMFDLQRRFGIHAASELIFPLLSLLVIEGTIRDLDPNMDFQKAAEPMLMRGLFGTKR
ncbi:2-polyprenylphenol hydroxylase [Actinosynnema sp. ALI-1.44]|uniref:ABC1 kinase family protein n=1 Tax=Actinosynnema sp. ALI-1.44 TaxID=1933779 RepID=UPI00097C3D78|nr:AarF/UbiB family protein [Actinosynnema sp. ALI-1.44]ONI76377.1 2-polyprenylphenol hydroxylase [Actinosynnema sp. ALI-1.44]